MRRGEFLRRGDVLRDDAPTHHPLDPIHRHLEVDSRLFEHGLGGGLLHLVVRRLLRLEQQVGGVLVRVGVGVGVRVRVRVRVRRLWPSSPLLPY